MPLPSPPAENKAPRLNRAEKTKETWGLIREPQAAGLGVLGYGEVGKPMVISEGEQVPVQKRRTGSGYTAFTSAGWAPRMGRARHFSPLEVSTVLCEQGWRSPWKRARRNHLHRHYGKQKRLQHLSSAIVSFPRGAWSLETKSGHVGRYICSRVSTWGLQLTIPSSWNALPHILRVFVQVSVQSHSGELSASWPYFHTSSTSCNHFIHHVSFIWNAEGLCFLSCWALDAYNCA